MGKSGALSCLNEPRDEQKHKPQLVPAGLGEPLLDRRDVFFFIRHDTASPSPESWDSVFSCDPPVASSSGAHPFISARRAAMAWRVSCTLFTPAAPVLPARSRG
nr:MAG TPA: hypothetical protein [Caudoviricetes sp.]